MHKRSAELAAGIRRMTNDLRNWVVSFVFTAASIFVSYKWIDRPMAFFVHDRTSQSGIFVLLQKIPEAFPPLAALVFVALGVLALTRRRFSTFQAVMLLCGLSLVVADAIKNQLKFVFGRTWPETWVSNNPSLIHNGVYGFNPFHGGVGYASFPSGHAAAICAVMSVLWICYPRFRPLYALCVAAVVVGLIGADYHFLSDVIAGGFIGVWTGWITVVIWQNAKSES
jgi:membrane-associated phospholipid phosphatase